MIAAREEGSLDSYAVVLVDRALTDPASLHSIPRRPAARNTTFDDTWKKFYLELLLVLGSHRSASALCGYRRETVLLWKKEDPEFALACSKVLAVGSAMRRLRTRAELERRGIDGFNRVPVLRSDGSPVLDPETGEPVYRTQYSDAALGKLADMDFPETKHPQGPLVEVNTTGVVRLPEPSLTEEEFERRYGHLKRPPLDDDDR